MASHLPSLSFSRLPRQGATDWSGFLVKAKRKRLWRIQLALRGGRGGSGEGTDAFIAVTCMAWVYCAGFKSSIGRQIDT